MDLLTRFAQGDLDTFETLFRQFQGDVYAWIVRIVRDRGAAEDLTVETFWRIWRARARFDPARNFAGWARRIATNLALDHLKTCRAEVTFSEDLSPGQPPDPAIRRDLHDQIARAFRQLPAKFQAAATLALIEQTPYGEIAEALNISQTAVKLRVFRAVRMLRRKLRGWGIEP